MIREESFARTRHTLSMGIWTQIDYPVLKAAVAASLESAYSQATCDQIAAATGLERVEVVKSVRRLGERYLHIRDDSSLGGADFIINGVTSAGLEAAEVWPSPDALQQRFIAALEKLIEETPQGSPKASRLEGVLLAVRDLATGTGANLFGQLIYRAISG